MAGLNVANLKGFKAALPVRGTVELEIVQGRDFTGKEDADGEKSRGYALKYRITGPDFATMTDGNSAIGYEFEEIVTLPRAALIAEKPKAAEGMNKRVINRITAAFGEDFPDEISGTSFTGKNVKAEIYTQFDSFAGEEIVKIDHLLPVVPF